MHFLLSIGYTTCLKVTETLSRKEKHVKHFVTCDDVVAKLLKIHTFSPLVLSFTMASRTPQFFSSSLIGFNKCVMCYANV